MGAGFLRRHASGSVGRQSPLLWKLLRPGPAKALASQGQVHRLGRSCPGGGGAVMGAQTRVSRLRRLLERGGFSAEH
jgi:hypothetical protein